MSLPKLYTFKESGNCYKVRLFASLLDIPIQEIEIDFRGAEHHSPEFLTINPKGTLPTLVHGDHVFTDSAAILTYLAGTYPDEGSTVTPSSWWSSNVVEQAHVVDWLAFASSSIQFGACAARSILLTPNCDVNNASTKHALAEAKTRGDKSLSILEKRFKEEKWLALGRPTIADVAVFVYIALAPVGDISLEPYPSVKNWIQRVKQLPRFISIVGLDDPLYHKRDHSASI